MLNIKFFTVILMLSILSLNSLAELKNETNKIEISKSSLQKTSLSLIQKDFTFSSSKFTGSVLWTIGYKFNEIWNSNLGFKYLYVDYDKDSFLRKISEFGSLLSFGYIFY